VRGDFISLLSPGLVCCRERCGEGIGAKRHSLSLFKRCHSLVSLSRFKRWISVAAANRLPARATIRQVSDA
jgi:hypothetical protein